MLCLGTLASGLGAQAAEISGRVTARSVGAQRSPQGLDSATVRLVASRRHVMTDKTGRYGFPELAPGSYAIRVSRDGYFPESTTVVLGARGARSGLVRDFALRRVPSVAPSPIASTPVARPPVAPQPAVSPPVVAAPAAVRSSAASTGIRGRVTNEFRQGLSGARILIPPLGQVGAITDSAGEYALSTLERGGYTVTATLIGYRSVSRTVMLDSSQMLEVDFELLGQSTAPSVITRVAANDTLPSDSVRLDAPKEAVVRQTQVRVTAPDVRMGDIVSLPLFEDLTLTMMVAQVTPYRTEGYVSRGTVTTASGQWRGSAVLVFSEGRMTGNIRIGPRLYMVRAQSRGVHTIAEVDPARLPREIPDTGVASPPPSPPTLDQGVVLFSRPLARLPWLLRPPESLPRSPLPAAEAQNSCSAQQALTAGVTPQVRLLVGYTSAVASANTLADVEATILMVVKETELAMQESGIRIDLELVGTTLVAMEEPDAGVGGLLKSLHQPLEIPAVATLHALRNSTYADVVGLLTEGSSGGMADQMLWPHRQVGDSGFLVVNRKQAGNNLLFAHELGHVFGAAHLLHPMSKPAGGPRYEYAYPYFCAPAVCNWMTIMGMKDTPPYVVIPRFSNPAATYQGRATGSPTEDTHLALSNAAGAVASFRITPIWMGSTGPDSPWSERRVAPEALQEIRLADLDGDGMADAFRIDQETGTWSWSHGTRAPWAVRSPSGVSRMLALESVRFAYLDGVPGQDVFWIDAVTRKWMMASGGAGHSKVLNELDMGLGVALTDLAFGDFNGDEIDDVFRSNAVTGEWWISWSGTSGWVRLEDTPAQRSSRKVPTSSLRLGDFDGDHKVDVFRVNTASPEGSWQYSQNGTNDWQSLSDPAAKMKYPLSALAIGEFTGDSRADVFAATGTDWFVSDGGRGAFLPRTASCFLLSEMWVADLDGDGVLDLFRTGTRP